MKKPGEVIDWTLTCASTQVQPCDRLVGRGGLELGDSLGALGDSVFGQLAGEHEADRSLDLSRGDDESVVKWMKIKPGPRDRGPLTLLGYLRHAILEMGGFPGFYGNAAYEPLRRELVEGLEPF